MKEKFMDVLGCIPPVIPVTDVGPNQKKCPLYYLIEDEDKVRTQHIIVTLNSIYYYLYGRGDTSGTSPLHVTFEHTLHFKLPA